MRVGRYFGFGYFSLWHIFLIAAIAITLGALIYIIFKRNQVNKYKVDYISELKKKYILEEISEKEYLRKKKILENE